MLKSKNAQKPTTLFLRRHHQSLVLSIENNVLSSEHDITVDLKIGTAIALNTTEASIGIHLSKSDGVTWNHGGVRWTHCYTEIWKLSVARVGKAADLGVVGCALDFCVVGACDLWVDEEERGTSVCYFD